MKDLSFDFTDKKLTFSDIMDPETYLCELFIKKEDSLFLRLKMTHEQQIEMIAQILGCSIHKISAFCKILQNDEALTRSEESITKRLR